MTKKVINCRVSSWAPCRGSDMTRKWKLWQRVCAHLLCCCASDDRTGKKKKVPKRPKLKESNSFCFSSWWSTYFIKVVHLMADEIDLKAITFQLRTRKKLKICLCGMQMRKKQRLHDDSSPLRSRTGWCSYLHYNKNDIFRTLRTLLPPQLRYANTSTGCAALHNRASGVEVVKDHAE